MVIGGCVLPILGIDQRITVDIDISGPDTADMEQTIALMKIAEDLGLPVEAINLAGGLFLRRIPGWEQNLVEVHRGPQATLHVPDTTLFLLLKLARLTEIDLDDCLAMLQLSRQCGSSLDSERIVGAIHESLGAEAPPGKRQRLESLLAAVGDDRADSPAS